MNQAAVTNQTQQPTPSPNRFANFIQQFAEILLAGASVVTSALGAMQLISEYKPVAIGLALGLNTTLYATAHSLYEVRSLPPGYKFPKLLRLSVWLICLVFSVWLSFTGFFKLYMTDVNAENRQRAVQEVVYDAAAKLNQLKSVVLGHLNAQLPSLEGQIVSEARRIEFARRKGLPVSSKQLELLKAKRQRLERAIQQLNEMKLLDSTKLNGEPNAVRQELFEAFQRAAEAHALLPEALRLQHPLPQMKPEPPVSETLQTVALEQLRRRDTAAWFLLFVALALDLCPTLSVRARTPMRRVSTLIRDARLWVIGLWRACFRRLSIKTPKVRLAVEDYGQLDLEVVFGKELRGVYLRDLQCHLETIEQEISKLEGQPMRICATTSSTGSELVPDELPLSAQLNEDLTILLRLEPVGKEVNV